jgi:hypothetical protein
MANHGLIRMTINSPLLKIALRYGLVASVIGFALVVLLFYTNKHPFLIPVYIDFRIFLFGVFIFFALKEFREQYAQGILYFWQGMVGSYVFILSFAAATALAIYLLAWIDITFVSEFVRLFTEQASSIPKEELDRVGKEDFARNLSALSNTNGLNMAMLHFKQSLIIGFFISIIVTIILRKQPK